jgi:hypothetical protein
MIAIMPSQGLDSVIWIFVPAGPRPPALRHNIVDVLLRRGTQDIVLVQTRIMGLPFVHLFAYEKYDVDVIITLRLKMMAHKRC